MATTKCSGCNDKKGYKTGCEDAEGDAIMGYSCYKCQEFPTGCSLVVCPKCGEKPSPNFVIASR